MSTPPAPSAVPSTDLDPQTEDRDDALPPAVDPRDDGPLHVLLVEDNPGDARLVEEELRSGGGAGVEYTLDHVETLADALDRLAAGAKAGEPADVVLLDLSLPDSDGLETVLAVHEQAPWVPIVVLTGREDEQLAVRTLHEGAQDYVVKGRYTGTLPRAIRYAVERRRAAEELDALRRKLAVDEKLATLGALVAGVTKELRAATTEVTRTLHRVRKLAERATAAGETGADAEADDDAATGSASGGQQGEVAAAVAEAMEGLDRVDRLVQDLRRFYRTDDEAREEVGLHAVAAEAVDLFKAAGPPSAGGGPVDLDVDLEETPPANIQRAQFRQVVLNLLENAVEAMHDGGRVAVRTRTADGTATIEVADEGPGLPDEVRDRLFEPFVSTKEGSDGLGLSVAKRIVDAHGGEIRVETSAEGTTFTVALPLGA